MTKWFAFFAIMFLVCSILSGITEATYLGSSESGAIYQLMFWREMSFNDPFSFVFSVPIAGWSFIKALWQLFSWDYSFFDGQLAVFRYMGWCISLGLIVTFIMSITRRSTA
jgi:hypothetical protein